MQPARGSQRYCRGLDFLQKRRASWEHTVSLKLTSSSYRSHPLLLIGHQPISIYENHQAHSLLLPASLPSQPSSRPATVTAAPTPAGCGRPAGWTGHPHTLSLPHTCGPPCHTCAAGGQIAPHVGRHTLAHASPAQQQSLSLYLLSCRCFHGFCCLLCRRLLACAAGCFVCYYC